MAGSIRVERDGHVGLLIFDQQAKRNAITAQMWHDIPGAVAALAADPEVRIVIMRGAGELAFVAGADISEFAEHRSGEAAQAYDEANLAAFAALAGLEKPLIAMIHGFCVGGGVALAIHADLRYSAGDGRFGVPAARLGVGYFMSGVETLGRLVGYSSAKEIFFTGRRFDAAEALRIGLLNAVFPKAELEAKVMETARTIAENAPLTIRAVKLATQELQRNDGPPDEARVAAAIADCYGSQDYVEGFTAFLEKRTPRFTGR